MLTYQTIDDYYKNYVKETYNAAGQLETFEINVPENFNFAYDIVDVYADIDPFRPALMWTDEAGRERAFTFGELSQLSTMAANLFASRGITRGDKVMLVLKRDYQFWYVLLGLMKLGAIAVPATHLLTAKDFVYRFEQADVSSIIVSGSCPDVVQYIDDADRQLGGVLKSRFIADLFNPFPFWQDFDAELRIQPDVMKRVTTAAPDYILLYFTSGTTGYPKMVVHNHRYPLAHVETARWQNIKPHGRHLTVAETGWAKAVWGKMFGQMILGCEIFVYAFDKFNPQKLLTAISKYKVTSFCAPPTMYRFFIKEGLEAYDLSSLKYSTIAGEALNPEVYLQWLKHTGLKLMEGFGQTETTVMLANLPGTEPKPGSMGKPLPLYNLDIVDPAGKSLPPGEVGEIVGYAKIGDDGYFQGYYNNQEMTELMWHDGLYHTGDTAWRDEDGYYWYVGRTDDMIKSSGYRIGPFEIESVLVTHPSVLECAVTGAPDPIRGQVVKASVVLAKGYTGSPELAKELQAHVKQQTAPYKYPRIVEFVAELPKTISGKIRRAEIRENDNK